LMLTPRRYRQVRGTPNQVTKPITDDQMRFVLEYLQDLNPGAAAARAGLDPANGRIFLASPRVQTAIQVAKAQRSRRTEIYADEVLRAWELARRVDYNEFVTVLVPPCRYCWGVDHHFQFVSLHEMQKLARAHARNQRKLPERDRVEFDTEGGEGYSLLAQPCRGEEWRALGYEPTSDHSCPECHGAGGPPRALVRDTRYLSPGARYIYEGADVGRRGELKLNLRPRRDFDDMVGRHLGLLGSASRAVPSPDPSQMSDEQLDSVLETHGITVEVDYEDVTPEDKGDPA
jgi:phage terminase small subunit